MNSENFFQVVNRLLTGRRFLDIVERPECEKSSVGAGKDSADFSVFTHAKRNRWLPALLCNSIKIKYFFIICDEYETLKKL